MHLDVRTRVAALFPKRGPRRTRVGLEQELLTARLSGEHAGIDEVRAATCRAAYRDYLSFEPGGQVELSLPCAASAAEIAARLRDDVDALRHDLAAARLLIDASPVDPRSEHSVPLQLTSQRYLAMQTHFDSIGPAGRRMMRRTASTQVCLDWWPGREGREQWRVLNLAGPFLAAAFARSWGDRGRLTTWLAVDPPRTAFDDRLLHGDDPVAAYTAFAAGATAFLGPDEHLSTLFPPVRPRGDYLEVRFLDAQEVDAVLPVVQLLTTLLYDGERRRRVLGILEPGRHDLADQWRAAADGDAATLAQGREITALLGMELAA
ncbi:gamma-glutamylcysteine synthetase [Marmoricola sp. URHA0025 HA25]